MEDNKVDEKYTDKFILAFNTESKALSTLTREELLDRLEKLRQLVIEAKGRKLAADIEIRNRIASGSSY